MTEQSLGLIETIGLAAAVEAADAAVKSANVQLVGYELTNGDGMTVVKLRGEVGAIKAAVAAGAVAAERVNRVVSTQVIARPARDVSLLVDSPATVGVVPAEPVPEPAAGTAAASEPAAEAEAELSSAAEAASEVSAPVEAVSHTDEDAEASSDAAGTPASDETPAPAEPADPERAAAATHQAEPEPSDETQDTETPSEAAAAPAPSEAAAGPSGETAATGAGASGAGRRNRRRPGPAGKPGGKGR
ncbi:BMC domain-containing protein [Rhodovulum kholense]|uniref:Microcompartment protein CcmL/EutN n=1 Tax=Rhodovulum kholense TaxID=453584 RepID=A0A8E2VLZ4_9RHOB|nr:microcompartment protein CcmL/EutN [Rhodovulum kholense]